MASEFSRIMLWDCCFLPVELLMPTGVVFENIDDL